MAPSDTHSARAIAASSPNATVVRRLAAAVGLGDLTDLARRSAKTLSGVAENARDLVTYAGRAERRLQETTERLTAIERQLGTLQRELSDRLLQYNLQLGRIATGSHAAPTPARATSDADTRVTARLAGRPIPMTVAENGAAPWVPVGEGAPHPDPDGREWMSLAACPMCGHAERSIVLEWNKLIQLEKGPDQQSARYDYAVCHACGVLYASRRPYGDRYRYLLEHFGEVTGKWVDRAATRNPMLDTRPLTAASEERLRQMASRGVFVSEHLGLKRSEYLDGMLKDRFENSVHVDVIGSLVAPRRFRVLELRPRAGTIAESLRRLFDADVSVVPIWESQKFLLKEVYGLDSTGLIDYDRFEVPYEGRFDLIVCNHMLTHMLRPGEYLERLRSHLTPGGYVYLYNEPDDAEYLEEGQSVIAHQNPVHMQTFDQRSLIRALAANGFETIFQRSRDFNHICLARATETTWTPMSEAERDQRVESYRRARARAILKMPDVGRARVAAEWPAVVAQGLADRLIDFDGQGQLKLIAD